MKNAEYPSVKRRGVLCIQIRNNQNIVYNTLNIQRNVFNVQCAQFRVADLVDRINCRSFHNCHHRDRHHHIYDFESCARGRTQKWHCYCLWTDLERDYKLTFFLSRVQTTSQSHRTLFSVLGRFFAKINISYLPFSLLMFLPTCWMFLLSF